MNTFFGFISPLPATCIGVWRDWGVAPSPGVFASCLRCRFRKKRDMSLSFRARVIDATHCGVPSGDVIRWARPVHFIPALKFARDAYSPQAARDGMEFVRTLHLRANTARPASRWKRSVRKGGAGSPLLSDRAAGVSEEVARVMGDVKVDCRRAVFGRHVMTFQFQGWFLGAAQKLREQLAPFSPNGSDAVERWLQQPFAGDWPFPLSCKGREVVKPPAKDSGPVQNRRPAPGRPASRRHVVLVIRGVAQLARRLEISGNPSRTGMLRATRSSDDRCFPFAKTFGTHDGAPPRPWSPRRGWLRGPVACVAPRR